MLHPPDSDRNLDWLRRAVLAVVLAGAIGLGTELLLLEHYEDPWQLVPLVLLALVVPATGWLLGKPSPIAVRVFRGLMIACTLSGVLGMYLHYRGNVEFELERAPELRGLALFREAMQGATPALASGALLQLGVLGLLAAFRHPSLPLMRKQQP